MRETALQGAEMSEEGGTRRCFVCQSRDSAAAPEKTMVRQTVPCSLLKDYSGDDLHPAGCGQLHTGAGRCTLKGATACGEPILEETGDRNCSPWREAHRGAGFLMGDLDCSSLFLKN